MNDMASTGSPNSSWLKAAAVALIGCAATAAVVVLPPKLQERQATETASALATKVEQSIATSIDGHRSSLTSLLLAKPAVVLMPIPGADPLEGRSVTATNRLFGELIIVGPLEGEPTADEPPSDASNSVTSDEFVIEQSADEFVIEQPAVKAPAIDRPAIGISYRYEIAGNGSLTRTMMGISQNVLPTLKQLGLSPIPAADAKSSIISFDPAALIDQSLFAKGTVGDAATPIVWALALPMPNTGWAISPLSAAGAASPIDRLKQASALTVSVHAGTSSAAPLLVQRRATEPPAASDVRWTTSPGGSKDFPLTVLLGYERRLGTTELVNPLLAAFVGLLTTMLLAAWVGARGQRRHLVAFEADLAEAKELARTDALTGLGNRLACNELLDALVTTKAVPSVLLCDLDRFKVINDARGHETGDLVLIEVAKRIKSAIGEAGHVMRFGGDEFVIVMPQVTAAQAVDKADSIVSALREPFAVGSDQAVIGVSVGLSRPKDGTTTTRSDLLRDADMAMYLAKRGGGNRVAVAGDEVLQSGADQLNLEIGLRAALGTGQLRAWYQPIVGVNREVEALEALVRWEHPERGLLAPGVFLPAAKSAGLLAEISSVVLGQACNEVARWNNIRIEHHLKPLVVHVNCVEEQLLDPSFADVAATYVRTSGIDPKCLMLEISEETALERLPATVPTLELLKAIGIRFSLDDFGFGNSSLTMVRQLGDVSELKIDKSIVDGLASTAQSSEADLAIVRAVSEFARNRGISVVAEGIEQEHQFNVLKSLGVELFQGYLFFRPQPVAALERILVGAPISERILSEEFATLVARI